MNKLESIFRNIDYNITHFILCGLYTHYFYGRMMTHNIQITNCVHHWARRGNFRLFISCEFCVKHTERNHYNVPTWKQTQRLEITFFYKLKIDSPLNSNFKQREISITIINVFANKVYPSSTLSVCLWYVISKILFLFPHYSSHEKTDYQIFLSQSMLVFFNSNRLTKLNFTNST